MTAEPLAKPVPRLDLFCLRPGSRIFNLEFQTSTTSKKIHDYSTGKDVTNMESQGTKGDTVRMALKVLLDISGGNIWI